MGKKPFFLLIISIITILVIVSVALFLNRGLIVSKIIEKSFLKAGKPLKFGNYIVFIDRIEGNKLFGIKMNGSNRKFEAKSGDYTYLPKEKLIDINLFDGVVEDSGSDNTFLQHKLTFKKFHIIFKIKQSRNSLKGDELWKT